jgi:hypothetical protein
MWFIQFTQFIQFAVSGSTAAIKNVGPEDLVCGMQLELPGHLFDVISSRYVTFVGVAVPATSSGSDSHKKLSSLGTRSSAV